MGVQFGSDRSPASTTTGGVVDQNGNAIISANNSFGQFPLGAAPLAQTLFGLPNGTFNLLPPVIGTAAEAEISNFDNPLPYWQVDSDESLGEVKSFIVYDETTNTTALRLTPGTAAAASTYSVSTRSAVISDDNLSLRQKAIATLEKVGTYAGTTQFYVKLDATYYDHAGSAISTQPIGTVYDNAAISSITGFTTAGTAAVGISAAYVDLKFSLVTTQAVTSGISVDINTLLLQTSQGGGGASSFLVTETFTSSTTWTPPTGVETLVAVVAVGGGGGGDGGMTNIIKGPTTAAGTVITVANTTGAFSRAGNSGYWAYATNLPVGTASISIGVGAGGAGGSAGVATKAAGSTTTPVSGSSGNGATGGATTFGSYITANGGESDTTAATLSTIVYGVVGTAVNGSGNASSTPSGTADTSSNAGSGTAAFGTVITVVPFTTGPIAGGAGGSATYSKSGTATTTVSTSLRAGGTAIAGLIGGGSGSGDAKVVGIGTALVPTFLQASTGTAGAQGANNGGGAGGGSGAAAVQGTALTGGTVTITVTGGAGGTAGYYGSGGGGGGQAVILCGNSGFYDRSILTATGGAGGAGQTGFVVIAYIA